MGCATSSVGHGELDEDEAEDKDDDSSNGLTASLFKRNLQQAKRDVLDDVENRSMGSGTQNLLNRLMQYCYLTAAMTKKQKPIGDLLARDGAAELFKAYFDIYSEKITGESPLDRDDLHDFKKLLDVCVNYSDASSILSEAIAQCDILLNLVQYLRLFQNTFTQQKKTQGYIVLQAITILYNCSISSNNKKYYKEMGGVELIGWYAENTKGVSIGGDDSLSACSMLTLAHITDEDDNDVIETDDAIINYILEDLDNALDSADLRSMLGFSAKELALGLNKLANNDINSALILRSGALPKIMQLIKKGDVEEQTIAVNCIWALSFVEENNAEIRNEAEVIEKLEELSSHREKQLRKAASGALWVLKGQSEANAAATTLTQPLGGVPQHNGESPHLMLSYSWDNQDLIKQVKTHLESHGYNVWMDVDRMGGSTLQAMADAVEQSAVVLICMSQKYKDSPNCRTEGEYAYKLQKDIIPLRVEKGYSPNGWLGAILGAKFYYNVERPDDVPAATSNLVRELGERGRMTDGEASLQTVVDGPRAVVATQQYSQPPRDSNPQSVNLWTTAKVQEWAKRHGLKQSTYKKLDGETLSFLQSLKSEAPEFFYRHINERLNLREPRDLMLFTKALSDLG